MNIPYVHIDFDPDLDCASNSILIRAIRKLMKINYDQESDSFTNGINWKITIEDKHDEGEPEPHYSFDMGEGDVTGIDHRTYRIRYCDFLSKLNDGDEAVIETAPGEWKIRIWVPNDFVEDVDELAKAVNAAYAGAMEKTLPQYEIFSSEPILVEE